MMSINNTVVKKKNDTAIALLWRPSAQKTTVKSDLLAQIKSDPEQFIAQAQNLDPDSIKTIISLLEALRETSISREEDLITDLNNKKTALADSNTRLVDAADALDAANNAVQDAQDVLTGKETDAASALDAHDQAKADHIAKTGEKNTAQTAHDDEVPSLNDEQQVLTDVIEMMKGLHEKHKHKSAREFGYCGSVGYTILSGSGSSAIVRGTGPTLDECQQQYTTDGDIIHLENVVGDGIQQFLVPASGLYNIECWGASGKDSAASSYNAGRGVRISASYDLTEGDNLFILVGRTPEGSCNYACGAGGGSFVMKGTSYEDATPLVVAGGGGGAGNSGGHGQDASFETSGTAGHPGYGAGTNGYGSPSNANGGWGSSGAGYRGNGNGANSWNGGNHNLAYSFWNGGGGASGYLNGINSCNGQFGGFGGGGGGACDGAGGGGGYSGGAQGGGGGGSYTGSGTDRNEIGHNSGDGKVIITITGQ